MKDVLFYTSTPISSTIKNDHHKITTILISIPTWVNKNKTYKWTPCVNGK
jgi:hypothetical protein